MVISLTKHVKVLETHPRSSNPDQRGWSGAIKNDHNLALNIEWTMWVVCADVL